MLDLQKRFKLGTIRRLVHQVGVEDTVGNKSVALEEFLSTSACLETMVRLAVEMVDPGLPEGVISVGVRSEILQQAPALLGNEVIFHLSLDRVEGNRLGFSLRVSDRHGTIATGNHERAVVSAALLAERAEKRTKEVL